ncbi:hypothetical protein [Streptomyces sp. NPDC016845]|uniref:hypothetical protein n=1 Tax=Streptomyces sp. NPDC016845 TaxID=3364972 RepID=UPI00378E3E80
MSLLSASVTWLGLGLTLDMAGLVTYGLATLPCRETVREEDAEGVCCLARRTAVVLGCLGMTAFVVGSVYFVLHVTRFR